MDNIKKIKKHGYKGEIIARMTISPDFPDIFEQVLFLINSDFLLFIGKLMRFLSI
jgi:hypothetical protein